MIDRSAAMAPPAPQPQTSERPIRDPRSSRSFEDMLGGSISPDGAQDANAAAPASELEVVLRDRNGRGQAIVLPWRRLANDSVSQMFPDSMTEGGGSLCGAPASVARDAHARLAPNAMDAPDPDRLMSASGPQAGALALAPAAASPVSATTRSVDRAGPAGLLMLAEPWQARLLRWIEEGDRGLTARLRDYRLGAADEPLLLERLQAFAREHGLRLERVVVNARELWRATA